MRMRWPASSVVILTALALFLLLVNSSQSAEILRSSQSLPLSLSENPTTEELCRIRVFGEPLVPIGRVPSVAENNELANALKAYALRVEPDDFSGLTGFLERFRESPWRASLLCNLGIEYYRSGHYSKTLPAWQEAWALSENASDRKSRAVADRSLGECAYMLARLGRTAELGMLLNSVKDRPLSGSATELIAGAKQGLWAMQHKPEIAFRCGPLALDRILYAVNAVRVGEPAIQDSKSTAKGFALSQVAHLSARLGMNYQMAQRAGGAEILCPAVVHWKVGHYAALIRKEGDRFLVQDPTFGNDLWMTPKALEAEASGYFLVRPGMLPEGWRAIGEDEGLQVWGKGKTNDNDKDRTRHDDKKKDDKKRKDDDKKNCGMAGYSVHLMVVSLNITDTPVGYPPPVGPPVRFTLTYNQREAGQNDTFFYSNLGPKWTCNWLAYLVDDPSNPSANVRYYAEGGGAFTFVGFNASNPTSDVEPMEGTSLRRVSGSSYEMRYPDGSAKAFSKSDGAVGTSRRIFLTRISDAAGNAIEIDYDDTFRITKLRDAIGQLTTLFYEKADDALKVTRVTDPFGRSAAFDYDSHGRLARITDVIGISSQFAYDSGDFITALTTPYGTSRFSKGETGRTRWLEITDAQGDKERIEYSESETVGVPFSELYSTVPKGMFARNWVMDARNTFYWDKKAYAEAYSPTNYTSARLYHWLHTPDGTTAAGVLESEKMPLENRVWYNYPGQASHDAATLPGILERPSKVGRVLDDGSTQIREYEYNRHGNLTRTVDPVGRTMSFIYDSNQVDLIEVRQTTGGTAETLARLVYNAQHRPTLIQDAAGQFTTNTYNVRGQLLSTSNARGEVTTYAYDTSGYLLAIDGSLPGDGDTIRYGYDRFGRIRSVTDTDGYTLAYSYDNLDRLTNVSYPDGTFTTVTFNKLDRENVRDRLGRETRFEFNPIRQLISVTDPLRRVTRFDYCNCGALTGLVDPMGRRTSWRYDIQSRLISKEYVDGSTIQYEYERTTSRLKSICDEKRQFTLFDYHHDDSLKRRSYPNALVATPTVTFVYETNYERVAAMQDGFGTTRYQYHPVNALGALKLAAVDGPWGNDTVTYEYDRLGRVASRSISGVAESFAYDELGRVTNVLNALGSFDYSYSEATPRVRRVSFPNGQRTHYDYFDNSRDLRLKQILNLGRDAQIVSRFDYAHDAHGNVTNWIQELGRGEKQSWTAAYDPVDQLTQLTINDERGRSVQHSYSYDPASNRLTEKVDNDMRRFAYNALNQLVSQSKEAPDPMSYEWDAQHRLVAVIQGEHRSEFAYDGIGRRTQIIEKEGGNVISEKRFLWCGLELCEEHDSSGSVLKRFFAQGVDSPMGSMFYARDHLGSVREVVDGVSAIRARYAYDPWGQQTSLMAEVDTDFAFTGYYQHKPSGLLLAAFRALDPEKGRWLSRDLIEEADGPNLYVYVSNQPITLLAWISTERRSPNADRVLGG